MIITCKNEECGFDIRISDEKLPDHPVRISCPKCRTPNNVYPGVITRKESGSPVSSSSHASGSRVSHEEIIKEVESRLSVLKEEILRETRRQQAQSSPAGNGGEEKSEKRLFDDSLKKALICDDDKTVRAIIRDSVATLGYISDEVESVDAALSFLKRDGGNSYSLVLIDKVFPDDPEGGYSILAHMASLPIVERRKIFVVFISSELKTRDSGSAFLLGANTLVNKKDLSRLSDILESDMEDYGRLYDVFRCCLRNVSSGRRHLQ